ncbi:hypothetical protein XPA_006086 [Xanthoria parietina]
MDLRHRRKKYIYYSPGPQVFSLEHSFPEPFSHPHLNTMPYMHSQDFEVAPRTSGSGKSIIKHRRHSKSHRSLPKKESPRLHDQVDLKDSASSNPEAKASEDKSDELHKSFHPFDEIQSRLFDHFFTGQRALQVFLHDVIQMDKYHSMLSTDNNSEGGSVPEGRLQTKSIRLIREMMVSYDGKLHQLHQLLSVDTNSFDSPEKDYKKPDTTEPATMSPQSISPHLGASHNHSSQDVPIQEATEQGDFQPAQPSHHPNHTVGNLDLNHLFIMNIVLIICLILIVFGNQQSQ